MFDKVVLDGKWAKRDGGQQQDDPMDQGDLVCAVLLAARRGLSAKSTLPSQVLVLSAHPG